MNNYTLLQHLNKLLQPERFDDYCPNGLQIEGQDNITKIVTGVSLTDDLIESAISIGATAIIVHHGIFWYKDDYAITGIKRRRIAKLINNGINLYAYHLPLDNHLEIGNNVQLAKILDIKISGQTEKQGLLWYGTLASPLTIRDFIKKITLSLKIEPLYFTNNLDQVINKVAWCTGGADGFFNSAINLGVDLYLTGEASEPVMSIAKESNVSFIAAGHYATERYGVMALGKYLQEKFSIETQFVELYNPL